MLRGWVNLPWTLVNWANGDQRGLDRMGFYVAKSCDGRTDFNSLAFLPSHRAMLDLLIAEGIAEECPAGDSIGAWQRYRKATAPRLTGIHWCVTGRCNLKCRHCHVEAPSGRYGELPLAAMAGLIEQFERANVVQVSLSGGEPFLRKDILDIIAMLAQKKIQLNQIFTNSLLVTDRHLEHIRKVGYWPAFQISFDGVGTHDRMRGVRGTEPKVIVAIERLRAAGFPVRVGTCIDALNIGALGATYRLMKELKVQAWSVAVPQETGNWRGTTTAASLELQAKAFAPLLKAWLKDGQPFCIRLGGFYCGGDQQWLTAGPPEDPAMRTFIAGRGRSPSHVIAAGAKPTKAKPDTPAFTPDSYACASCREQANLLPDGTLVTCAGFVDTILQDRMPNLLHEDLSKVWNRSFLRRMADMRKKDLLKENPDCACCDRFYKDCGGGCRASALTETGSLMAKDPVACELIRKGYRQRFQEIAASARRVRP
jgi:radical SAM protein with 4Fe4S-binding SPASM domain